MINTYCDAQKTFSSQEVAERSANKMKDSLNLNKEQHKSIYKINLDLNKQKVGVYRNNPPRDLLQKQIQQIENTRDTLYSQILSKSQFQLYKQKKGRLMNAK